MRGISADRVLTRLDELLGKNDYEGARRHLLYWLDEARAECDSRTELLILSELMGLCRKLGERDLALGYVEAAIALISDMGIENQLGAGTVYLNCATVYKAFGLTQRSLEVFEIALEIYNRELEAGDSRFAGLYNNMALTLVDLGEYDDALSLYESALSVLGGVTGLELEMAITYLNIASALEAKLGLEAADTQICEHIERAFSLIDGFENQNGYYAFVCEKCAPVFGYYGFFAYESDLSERARRIYEGA